MLELIDSHIHLDFAAFDEDRDALIGRAADSGIQNFVVPATTIASWELIAQLSLIYPAIKPAYGLHPYFSDTHTLSDCEKLKAWIKTHDNVAIGEIGLDYYRKDLDLAHQRTLFKAQLDIAKKHGLPVILHARKAVEAVIDELRFHQISQGIVHSFNGSFVQAMRLVDMGFKLGFGGAVTYPRATRLRALIKQLPLTAICLETDAPDQPSLAFRGKRNEPEALLEVLKTIAEIKSIAPEKIAKQTTQNTLSALNIC